MLLTIEVTQKDIDVGRKKSCTSCPIARALRRSLRVAWLDVFHLEMKCGLESGIRGFFPLPPAAQHFIKCFDSGAPVVPFSFDIDVPEWAVPVEGVTP